MNASLAACFVLLLQFAYEGHGATTPGGPVQYVNPTTTPATTGIKLTSSADVIEPEFTRDFYIMCSFPKPTNVGLATITSMVISKGVSDAKFKDIASVNLARPLDVVKLANVGANITGKLDPQDMTFLRLDWAFPSEDMTGVYSCEVNTLNSQGHPVSVRTSIRVTSKSPDIQSLVNQFRIFTKQQEDQLRKQNVTDQDLLNQIQTQKDQLRKQNVTDQELLNQIQTQKVSITNMKDKLWEQNVTDQDLQNQIQTQKVSITNMKDKLREQNVTITNMKDQLREQNVTANVTSLRHRVLMLENYMWRHLFNFSAVSAGKQYLVYRFGNVNISRAEALCNVAGGHLADIRSSAELDVIKRFMKTLASTRSQFYSSYFSPTQENHRGRWVYRHSAEVMTYTGLWVSGNPDNNAGYDCAYLSHSSWKAYNYYCKGYSNYNFICERAAVP